MLDLFAKFLLSVAMGLIAAVFMCGCSLSDAQNPFDRTKTLADNSAPQEAEDVVINLNGNSLPTTPNPASASAPAAPNPLTPTTFTGIPLDLPAPELYNVNRYARALEEKLLQRYNNTPKHAGNVGKVQLLPVGEPKVSIDGKQIKMEWSQVVFDRWGERLTELEKEFYVVTFGDGKPVMQRTRPTITVGLNNEGGYSEYEAVRGGLLSSRATVGSPEIFDRPTSERQTLLDDNLENKNAAPQALEQFSPAPLRAPTARITPDDTPYYLPVVKPARENLVAVVVE